ncbi:MAG: aspartyl protease family protein [Planctomycetota bacterium]
MGRIRQNINVGGRDFWTMFDTGARNNYVVPAVAQLLTVSKAEHPIRTALRGGTKQADTFALLQAEIEGHPISALALVVDKIGSDEEGKAIEILFGALAMQQWGIRLVPEEAVLDMSHYPKVFVEF